MANKSERRGSKKTRQRARSAGRGRITRRKEMPFSGRNYLLLTVGMLFVVVGYAIMRIENEVDGFISLYVSPILLMIGYLEIIYAIWWRPKEDGVDSVEAQ